MGAREPDTWTFGSKVPTHIALSDHHCWGYYVYDDPSFKWFKLGVPHEDEIQKDLSNAATLEEARASRRQHDAFVSDLLKAYLKGLWDYSMQRIISGMEGKMNSEQVRQSKFYVVIGAPANWRPGTLLFMLDAARAASIPGSNRGSKVETCVEPEAAAIALLLLDENIKMGLTVGFGCPLPFFRRLASNALDRTATFLSS